MGILVELVSICISLDVFKSRKVCKLGRELFSFFPPLFEQKHSLCLEDQEVARVRLNSCGI